MADKKIVTSHWSLIEAASGRLFVVDHHWPIWIHGAPKSGASFATVVLTADLVRRGEKIVFLCAHGDAIRALQQQLEMQRPEMKAKVITAPVAAELATMQLVTLKHEKGKNLATQLRALSDWSERVVVIKNVDELLTSELLAVAQAAKRLVLAGDFSKLKIEIPFMAAKTHVAFSPPPKSWPVEWSSLPSYIGQYWRGNDHGQVMASESISQIA